MQAYTSPRHIFGFSGKRLLMWSLGVVVVAAIILTGFFYNRNEISIHVDGKSIAIVMRGGTVRDAIKKAGITLGSRDIIEPPLNTSLNDNLEVKISRRICIKLIADGKEEEHWVPIGSVGQTLQTLKVSLNEGDKVTPDLNNILSSGQSIEVTRFSEKYISQTVKVPFKLEKRKDSSMERGNTKVVSQGQNGLIQKTIKITYKNGKEVSREIIGEKTIRKPVNKVVAFGTLSARVVSRGGSIRFSRVLRMNASAYSHTGNNTASGVYPYKGAVAVDPRVIPMGSRLYIEGYGYAKALDIGSAIRGNRIDLFFDSHSQAVRWGRRYVKVYILE